MGSILIGTSGYSYQDWKGLFYPEGLGQPKWLPFYAEHYNTVEINATFYRYFKRSVYEKWHALTPPEFRFAIKGPKSITRDKRLKSPEDDLAQFFEAAAGLMEKLSVVLWQMPPSFKNSPETLKDLSLFLEMLPRDYRHAIEFRHASWDTEEIQNLLNQVGVGWVSAESSRFVSIAKVTGGFGYFRYHGPDKLYASSYPKDRLEKEAGRIKELVGSGDAYCYFNNDFYGYALVNAETLKSFFLPES
jgi:uncharacterized protein YecE (DUF72 family)